MFPSWNGILHYFLLFFRYILLYGNVTQEYLWNLNQWISNLQTSAFFSWVIVFFVFVSYYLNVIILLCLRQFPF